jgi:iron-sulfur cluster assembly protein
MDMAIGLNLTDRAVARINELVATENRQGQGLRVKVVGGGCSGLQYKVDFDQPKATDKIFERDGAKVLVDMKSLLYLSGTELDYKDELMQSGFVFQNPNVKKACGCGQSFMVS